MSSSEALPEALSGLRDKYEKLIFLDSDNGDALVFSFECQKIRAKTGRDEQSLWQLLLVRTPLFQQALSLQFRRLPCSVGDGRGTHDEATRRVHEANEIETSVALTSYGCVIQLEDDPGLVDLKLAWLKHGA